MAATQTQDLSATARQIEVLEKAKADVIRIAVDSEKDVEALKTLRQKFPEGKLWIGGGLAMDPSLVKRRNSMFKAGSEVSALGIAKLANKIKANIAIANVQVVLSKKLFVFCTPPKDAPPPPPNEEDNPPPLGFCTITINIKATATIKIKIKNAV